MPAYVQHLGAILQNGSCEFSFCNGATTLAEANSNGATAAGWLEFGDIKSTTIKPATETKETKRVQRGSIVKTKTVTAGSLEFDIKCTEAGRADIIAMALMGTKGASITQSALATPTALTTITVPTAGFQASTSYPLMNSGAPIREILTYSAATSSAGTACTAANSGDVFTATSHGLANGDIVRFSGTMPTGVTAGQAYYIVNKADNTFQIALTTGGTAVVLGSDQNSNLTFKKCLVPDTDYVLDTKLGIIRFLGTSLPVADIVVYVTASAITATDTTSMVQVTLLDSISKTGFGWLRMWDDAHTNKLVASCKFKCKIQSTGGSDFNGETESQFDFTVTIDTDYTPVWEVAPITNN